ncbi:MAG: RNA pseudouridine synthase [Treponema sp.]|jgi:23S rRNA pseudouridine955/2504/2580 synthase|nr:RNA pseudouridine synthase [Treponema sp.]
MKNISILFENDVCLVVNKPAGLAVQGGAGLHTSLDALLEAAYGGEVRLVHRLDRDTSGVLLAAKGRAAAAAFGEVFAGRGARKVYLAVCGGAPVPPEGRIRGALEQRGVRRQAETRYRVLAGQAALPETSLVEVELGTGRMHQIRRHLAAAGCPILGDDKYGDFALNKRLRSEAGLKRLLLHAARLVLPPLPLLPEGLDAGAPLPPYFEGFVR